MSAPLSPSGESDPSGRSVPGALILLVLAISVARAAAGATLHLTEDEAYYRLWARSPALGYYDHPPMIAWWIWGGVRILGDTPLAVRLGPILASAVTGFIVFDLARQTGADRRGATLAAVLYYATPLVALGGLLAVPDAPAAFFWTISVWACLRASREELALGWWALAGLTAGLAALSKYSALFLAPGVLLWLLWSPGGRARLRSGGPWLALAIAVCVFSVNIAWNADHGWATFYKQFGRIAPHRFASAYLAEFLAAEAVLLNPFVAIALVGLAMSKPSMRERPGLAGLLITCAPFAAYLVLHSLHDRIEGHWPAPLFPALAVAAAAGLDRMGRGWLWLGWAAPALALILTLLGVGLIFAPPSIAGTRWDPAMPIRGWPQFAHDIEQRRTARGAAWVGTTSYGLAAELSTEGALHAPIAQIDERARWNGLALGAPADLSRPGLLIDLPRRIDMAALHQCFGRVQPLGLVFRGGSSGTPYWTALVTAPRRDILRSGCSAR